MYFGIKDAPFVERRTKLSYNASAESLIQLAFFSVNLASSESFDVPREARD